MSSNDHTAERIPPWDHSLTPLGVGMPEIHSFRKWAVRAGRLVFDVGVRNRTPVVASQLPLVGEIDGRLFVLYARVDDSTLAGVFLPDGFPLLVQLEGAHPASPRSDDNE